MTPTPPPDSSGDSEQLICFCHAVSRGQLIQAIREGAITLDLIRQKTCASTGCGGCEWEVLELLAEELKARSSGK